MRERLKAGDTNEEVLNYIVSRYGEFVLLKPRFNARNAILWAAPVLILIGGGALAFSVLRRRGNTVPAPLSTEEEAALRDILKDES